MILKNNHTSVTQTRNALGIMNHTGTFTKTCPQLLDLLYKNGLFIKKDNQKSACVEKTLER